MPIAVLDKGTGGRSAPAVRRRREPVGAARPAAGHDDRAAARCFGPVKKEVVYLMRHGFGVRIPTPPPFHNKGNLVFSLAAAGPLPGRAGRGAGRDGAARDRRPEAAGRPAARCAASSPATRASAATASRSGSTSPASRSTPRRRCSPRARRATWRRAPIEPFGLRAQNPQVWSLGVKEVWRVRAAARPGRSTRWAGRCGAAAKYGESGGSFIYPMGSDMIAIGLVVGLDYRDAIAVGARPAAAVQDAPADPAAAGGRRADRLGREDDPRGRVSVRCPSRLVGAGGGADRRQRRLRERAQAEGRPLRDALGHAGRRDDLRAAQGGCRSGRRPARSTATTAGCAAATSGATCGGCATCVRRSTADSSSGGAARQRDGHHPRRVPGGNCSYHRDAEAAIDRSASAPTPRRTGSSPSTSCRASSCRATAAATTSRTTSGSPQRVPREVAEAWVAMCPAGVYEIARRRRRPHRGGRDDARPTACSAVRSPPRAAG